MKNFLSILVTIGVTASLVACGDSEENHEDQTAEDQNAEVQEESTEEDSTAPVISDLAIKHATDIILGYDMAKDSYVGVDEENQSITLTIQVNAATNEEHAKELGDNFARALASGVAIYSDGEDYRSPSKDDLGEVYDYYDLKIGVGTDADNFFAQGAKVTNSPHITW